MPEKTQPAKQNQANPGVVELGPQSIAILKVLGEVVADLCIEMKELNSRLDLRIESDDMAEVECQICGCTFHAGDMPFVRLPGGDIACGDCYAKNRDQFDPKLGKKAPQGKTLFQVFSKEAEQKGEKP